MARSPLFDIYDPYGVLQDQAESGLLPSDEELIGGFPIKRKARISDLMPEEEQSGILSTLAQLGSSGLATAGYILDSPGALVRGILAGKPLSAFGSSEDRVTGRELLRQYGMIGDEDTWGNFAGSLAAEVALDPLSWGTAGLSTIFGQGAKTAAGKAAKAAGLLRNVALDAADTPGMAGVRSYMRRTTPREQLARIADPAARTEAERVLKSQFKRFGTDDSALDQVMGAFDDVRIPGTNIGFSYDIPFSDAIASKLDTLSNAARTTPGIGHAATWLSSAFSKPAGEFWSSDLDITNQIQDASRRAYRNAEDALYADRLRMTKLQREALGAQVPEFFPASAGSLAGQAVPEELRSFGSQRLRQSMADWVEGSGTPRGQYGPSLPTGGFYSKLSGSGDEMADWIMENVPELRAVRDEFANMGGAANAMADAAGLPTGTWASKQGTGWFPRQLHFFQQDKAPIRPGAEPLKAKRWSRAERLFGVQDNFGRSRNPYTDIPGGMRTFRQLTGNIDPRLDSAALQQNLINASDDQVRGILDQAFSDIGLDNPYQPWIDEVTSSAAYQAADPAGRQQLMDAANQQVEGFYTQLADLLRSADTQFAANNRGIFDSDPWSNMVRYRSGQAVNRANADELFRQLTQQADNTQAAFVTGGTSIPLADAAKQLGFSPSAFKRRWQAEMGGDVTNFSVNERMVNALKALTPKTQLGMPESGLLGGVDQFTNFFKVGALAYPGFHTRNLYSNAINAATHGAFNPFDFVASWRGSAGDYRGIARRLRNAPGFENLTDEERIAKYLDLTGATQVTGSNVLDDVTGSPESTMGGMFLGSDSRSVAKQIMDAAYQPGRSWSDFLNDMTSVRGVGITRNPMRQNTNPILMANDAIGGRIEDASRGGVFLNQLRKGVDPREAAAVSFLSNVDYRPSAFTNFERGLKRVLPFYSFQKGILPSIATNMVERPGGLQNQLIRAVTRGTQPSEDNFISEHLRQSAAIPLPTDLPGFLGGSGNPELQRYLTNIDLPWESTLQLFAPGVGATASARFADSLKKTGSNILGMTNPLIKAPIEYITNRQLYSGRELSNLYSVLEQELGPIGRPIEQAVVNFVPFGSRGLGLYRQLSDERMTPAQRAQKAAFNFLAGAKLTDEDQDKAKRQAARDMLNSILETTPGVRTYENIAVPEDVLAGMPKDQQQLYLLYKIIQSEAAKRARDKKRGAIDPMEVLGLVS